MEEFHLEMYVLYVIISMAVKLRALEKLSYYFEFGFTKRMGVFLEISQENHKLILNIYLKTPFPDLVFPRLSRVGCGVVAGGSLQNNTGRGV